MSFHFEFSVYWLLVPLAVVLILWVKRVDSEDTGGYLSGLGTVAAFFAALFILVVALCIIMAIHLIWKS